MLPLFLVFSVFLFLRGHDAPGGGFSAGLVASTGLVLYTMAYGARAVRRALRINLKGLLGLGLGLALGSALVAPILGKPFFSGIWWKLPNGAKIGTPTVFDFGVYLVVIGVVLTIMLAREESEA